MIQFTDNQLDMLCLMSDLHFQWFQKYNSESTITYDEVLKLNHQKMIDICESCFDSSDEMIDVIFESIIIDYQEMLKDLE